jgi:hypothetical protein
MEDVSSEQELLELLKEGKINEEEYTQLLEVMRTSEPSGTQHTNIIRKYLFWAGLVIVVIITAVILSLTAISPKGKEHKQLTISEAYWFHSDDRPSWIPEDFVPKDNQGHMLFHVDERFSGMTSAQQYRPFLYLGEADKRFVLKAEGHPDVQAFAERGCWSQEFYIRIPKKEYIKMVPGIPYTIHPVNSNPKYQWKVAPGVTICKPTQ